MVGCDGDKKTWEVSRFVNFIRRSLELFIEINVGLVGPAQEERQKDDLLR